MNKEISQIPSKTKWRNLFYFYVGAVLAKVFARWSFQQRIRIKFQIYFIFGPKKLTCIYFTNNSFHFFHHSSSLHPIFYFTYNIHSKSFWQFPKKSSFNFVFFSLTSTKKISPSIFPKFPHHIKDSFSDSKLSSSLCDLQQRNEIIINATTEAMEQGILSKGIIK